MSIGHTSKSPYLGLDGSEAVRSGPAHEVWSFAPPVAPYFVLFIILNTYRYNSYCNYVALI